MSARTAVYPNPSATASDTGPLEEPRQRSLPCPRSGLSLQVTRTDARAVVVRAAGEIDARTAERLSGVLMPRLASTARVIVVDLSGLEFLGVAGLEVLHQAQHRATWRGVAFRLVTGPACVERALRAAGCHEHFVTATTIERAGECAVEPTVPWPAGGVVPPPATVPSPAR